MKIKKILLLSDFAHPVNAGTERLVFGIAEWFTNNYGIQTDILCPNWKNLKEIEEINGVQIFRFSTHSIYRSNPLKRIFGFVKKSFELEKYDIYNGFYTMPPLISTVLAAKLHKSESVVTIFGREQLEKNLSNPMKKFLLLSTLNKASAITSYTWNLQKHLQQFFPEKNIFVTPGFSDHAFTPSEYDYSGEKIVLFVGRIVEEKGIFVLLDAFAKVLKKTPAKLVMIGPPYQKDLLDKKIASLGIKNQVDVLGFVDEDELNKWYGKCSVVAVPALFQDSFGLSLMEAIACEKPVISTDSLGLPGITNELIVKKNDSDELAEMLIKLFTDSSFYFKAQENTKKMAKFFNKEKVMENYLSIYSKITESK